MVCGLGFRRTKSLLLLIVLFSHLPIPKKRTCIIEIPKLCHLLKSGCSVNFPSNAAPFENRSLFNSVHLNGLMEPVPKAHAR